MLPEARSFVAAMRPLVAAAAVAIALGALGPSARADEGDEPYNAHVQGTMILQAQPGFAAASSGPKSFPSSASFLASLSANIFLDLRLWPGSEVCGGPEAEERSFRRDPYGIAAYPNLELYHTADPRWLGEVPPFFLRQTIGLGGARERVPGTACRLGRTRDERRLELRVGHFALSDVFDGNRYAHDPRTQFLNAAVAGAGAFDAPGDLLGNTWGLAAELIAGRYVLRTSLAMLPSGARAKGVDVHVLRAHSLIVEGEARHSSLTRPGAVRLLAFVNEGSMGTYDEALRPAPPDVAATRRYGRFKVGFVCGFEQAIAEGLGVFARLSANDGRNETLSYLEIDRSVTAGATLVGQRWRRPGDEVGAAFVVNALSPPHRRYLERGGVGSLVGDGAMRYAPEGVTELYYRLGILTELGVTAHYQLVIHPGYAADRGPVHLFGLRLHGEY